MHSGILFFLNHTVDGRNAAFGIFKNLVNNGINYQPQLVSKISSINRIYFDRLLESQLGIWAQGRMALAFFDPYHPCMVCSPI